MAKRFTKEQRTKNSSDAFKARMRATESARDRLLREGEYFPVLDSSTSLEAFYNAVRRYGDLEARYVQEYLQMPSGPRPIIEYKKPRWNGYEN